MGIFQENYRLVFSCVIIMCMAALGSSQSRTKRYKPPLDVPQLTHQFGHVSFDHAFSKVFGDSNVNFTNNGSFASIALDKTTGSGLASRNKYYYGFFSAAMKLPSGLSPGVVVAFYMTNAEEFPHNHDEIDFELLGHDKRNDWVLQTNVYANGSVKTGREEKFYLWFDPTAQHHHYSILWNNHHILFLVDNIPIRQFPRKRGLSGAVYPSKPMSVYATIWDGSEWATHGGKYPVDYKYAPFVASLTEMELGGCVWDPTAPVPSCAKDSDTTSDPVEGQEFVELSEGQVAAMDWARRKLMFYSYCRDTRRFRVMPPECKSNV